MLFYNIPGVGVIPEGVQFSMVTTLQGEDGPYENLVSYPANWLTNADAGWLAEHGITVVEPDPEPEPGPPSKDELKEYAAEKRRVLANGSTVVDVGGAREISVWTDAESRGAILGLVVAAGIDPSLTTQWKGADGVFHELNASEITTLALGMMAWVQACFAAEAAVLAGIEADPPTITSFEDVDSADWPTAA